MEKTFLNTTIIYVLASLGLICCCFSGLGIIPSGIAFYMAQSKLKAAFLAPENFDNIKGMETAKTFALVIFIINAVFLLLAIYNIYTEGWDNIVIQSEEIIRQYQEVEPQ